MLCSLYHISWVLCSVPIMCTSSVAAAWRKKEIRAIYLDAKRSSLGCSTFGTPSRAQRNLQESSVSSPTPDSAESSPVSVSLRTWNVFVLLVLVSAALAWINNEFVMTSEFYRDLLRGAARRQ